jgi:hypothetical protein
MVNKEHILALNDKPLLLTLGLRESNSQEGRMHLAFFMDTPAFIQDQLHSAGIPGENIPSTMQVGHPWRWESN